ncbi:unnamed protein product [Sphagnum compactum]
MAVQPKGLTGKRLTILSIDGGGVRGVISAIMLAELESKLQDLDGAERRLLDYFDLVAGTSTGGLITAMITTPSTKDPTRSLFTAKGVTDLYINIAATIFPLIKGPCGQLWTTIASLLGPKYKPKGLEKLLHDNLGGDLLLNALLSVIIPSFDMKLQQPVFFSSWQVYLTCLTVLLMMMLHPCEPAPFLECNFITGKLAAIPEAGSNWDASHRFAGWLSEEWKACLAAA